MSYVRLVNVTKRFGDVTAVDHLNYEIGKGECFSMLGPSGCGKTTTLRMVAGFEDLSDGEVWVGDRLLSSPKKNHYVPPEKRNFGMVFQAFAVWPHLSVYENVAFPLRIRKLDDKEIDQRTTDALKATNLLKAKDESPDFLSGGGKQRVRLGERCLLGANSGLGIALGDDCVVEAGLYVTAGAKVTLIDSSGASQPRTVAARELSGASNILFRRNSQTGRIEAIARAGVVGIELNDALHASN